jgi:phage gp36-like protein
MSVPVQSYASLEDLQSTGLPIAYFTGDLAPTPDLQQTFLNQTARTMDGYMAANPNITLPLLPPYDDQLIQCNVSLARYRMVLQRGYNPESPDVGIKQDNDAQMKWLHDLSAARVKLQFQATGPNPQGKQPFMVSARSRGLRNWGGNIRGSGGY